MRGSGPSVPSPRSLAGLAPPKPDAPRCTAARPRRGNHNQVTSHAHHHNQALGFLRPTARVGAAAQHFVAPALVFLDFQKRISHTWMSRPSQCALQRCREIGLQPRGITIPLSVKATVRCEQLGRRVDETAKQSAKQSKISMLNVHLVKCNQ
jgi:hypothetical protein